MMEAGEKLGLTLLYAEDEAVTRQVFCEVLSTKIRTVYQAANGREGLEMFRMYRPDVVLIDNNMPEMNGVSLARAVRDIDSRTHLIIVSGEIRRQSLMQMEQLELHYIKKPIRIRELLALLEKLAEGTGLPPSLSARAHRTTLR